MDLSIIIVAFRGYKELRETIEAVFKSQITYSFEVIVVDNGSADGTAENVERDFPSSQYPNLKLVHNSNNGFSKGNNLGVKNSTGEYVLLLNPDTAVYPDALQKCMDYINLHKDIGALGCKLIKRDGSLDLAARRSFPNPVNAFAKFTGLHKLFPKNKKLGAYNLNHSSADEIADVDALCGAFMLMPREVYNKVGMLDEEYFMYGEDIDLCYKIKQDGHRVVYYPEAVTFHFKGASSRKTPYKMLYHFHNAMWIFYRKHYLQKYPWPLNVLVYCGIWLRFSLKCVQNFFRKNKFVSK